MVTVSRNVRHRLSPTDRGALDGGLPGATAARDARLAKVRLIEYRDPKTEAIEETGDGIGTVGKFETASD